MKMSQSRITVKLEEERVERASSYFFSLEDTTVEGILCVLSV